MSDCLKLKTSNCKNCYKCIRHCPVKSIKFSGNQAHIVGDECVLCGQCFVVCPQNAKEISDSTQTVQVLLAGNSPVIASVAPSFIANYNGIGIKALRNALLRLGFADAEETAIGATMVKTEYEAILQEQQPELLISSCCHSVNLLIQKYFPGAIRYLANVVSPMQAHCMDIKRRYPDAKTVFIGPCVAKKDEAKLENSPVDAVLTFEQLTRWFEAEGIVPENKRDETVQSRARLFPTAGGILKTMAQNAPDYTYLAVDGMDNCIAALRDIEKGTLSKCFIEMSACAGSCIGGPVMEKYHRAPVRDYGYVSRYAGAHDFMVSAPEREQIIKHFAYMEHSRQLPGEAELASILEKMGKTKPQQELNCGSCGYNTCRDKAVAIYQGKAEISMCLPFLMEKSESFSNKIINNTPNAILLLNEDLEVQQMNRAAMRLMNIRAASDVLGEQVVRILDPKVFFDVMETGRNVHDRLVYLAEYKRYVEQTIIYDRAYHNVMCMMRDVTKEQATRTKKEQMARQTAEIADNVVDKQMRIVQEIASLLGETAAETKIALTRLKESMADE